MPERNIAKEERERGQKVMSAVNGMADMASRACWKRWHRTGAVEVALGSWLLVAGLILFFLDGYPQHSTICTVLLFVSVIMLVAIPAAMNRRFVIPSGMLLSEDDAQKPQKSLVILAFLILAGAGVFSVAYYHSALLLAGIVCAAGFMCAFAAFGKNRFFVLSICTMLAFWLAPNIASWLELGTVGTIAVAMLIEGSVVMPAGEHTFLNALAAVVGPISGEVPEDEDESFIAPDKPDAERITGILSSNDAELRYLAAAYLSNHFEPDTLKAVIYACFDSDEAVSAMARRTLSSIWGPDPDEEFRLELDRQHGGLFGKAQHIDAAQLAELDRRRRLIEKDSKHREQDVEAVLRDVIANDEKAFSGLLKLAGEPDVSYPETQYVAAEMLGSTRSHRAYATLASLILGGMGNRELVRSASEGFRGAEAGASVHLEPLLADKREWVRVAALDACLELVDGLDETDAADAALARALLHDSVFELASHAKPVTRAMTLCLLARFGDEAVPKLESSCSDRFALVRGEGVRALSIADASIAARYVLAALQDRRAFVRSTALACAAYLRLSDAKPLVEKMIDDPDDTVATLAERLLMIAKTW